MKEIMNRRTYEQCTLYTEHWLNRAEPKRAKYIFYQIINGNEHAAGAAARKTTATELLQLEGTKRDGVHQGKRDTHINFNNERKLRGLKGTPHKH